MSLVGHNRCPSQPCHVSFRRLQTLVRTSICWSSRPSQWLSPARFLPVECQLVDADSQKAEKIGSFPRSGLACAARKRAILMMTPAQRRRAARHAATVRSAGVKAADRLMQKARKATGKLFSSW
jgi:hypothetical protein